MNRLWPMILVLLLVPIANVEGQTAFSNRIDATWLSGANWQGPKTEVSVFDGRDIVYRKSRPTRVTILVVRNQIVPSDRRRQKDGALPAIDVQINHDTNIGISDRNLQVSLVLNDKTLLPLFFSSIEQYFGQNIYRSFDYAALMTSKAVGRSFVAQMHQPQKGPRMKEFSFSLKKMRGAIPYEALPVVLRALSFDKGGFSGRIVEPTAGTDTHEPRVGALAIVVQPEETFTLRGENLTVRPILASHFLGEDRFWIEVGGAKRLVKWARYNGGELTLRKFEKLEYWKRTNPTDAGLLEY